MIINKRNKNTSNIILYSLGKLPFYYNGDMEYITNECNIIIKK